MSDSEEAPIRSWVFVDGLWHPYTIKGVGAQVTREIVREAVSEGQKGLKHPRRDPKTPSFAKESL